tara:strand:- start:481 stop:1149 length:669 start_codon:yes stop_codon:yes gene_type:complete
MSEIFLDTETTGLSYKDGHKIVEIACLETRELIPTNKKFHVLINPQRKVSEDAFKVHGYSTELLSKKKNFSFIAKDFLDFIKDKKIIIHNAPFDLGFLNNELRLLKLETIGNENVVDTLELARSKYPGSSNSLDSLCKKFNIDLSRRKKHNAMLDCELLREVYINLLGAKEPKLFSPSNYVSKITEDKDFKKVYFKKVVAPTEIELSRHQIFITKEIKKNFY